MVRLLSRAVLCLAAAVVGVTPLRAQAPLSLEGYVGIGKTAGGDYDHGVQPTYGGHLDLRVAQLGATRLLIGVEAARFGTGPSMVTVTGAVVNYPPASFPGGSYIVATAGVRHAFASGQSVEFGAGFGSVKEDADRTHPALWWTAEVSERLTDAWSVVLGVRNIQWTHAGNTLHAYPITIGLRLD